MAQLSDAARLVADSLRAGDLDRAQTLMQTLQQEIASSASADQLRETQSIVLEARNMASVHRSQTIASLRELVRGSLYEPEAPAMTGILNFDA